MPAETPTDPLAGLHDLALSAPPDWLPPQGPSWIVLGVLLVTGLAWTARQLWRRYRRNRYRREALAELGRLFADPDRPVTALEISTVLKRTALAAFPRTRVAALSGAAWRDFLCSTGAPAFADSGCVPMFDGTYRGDSSLDPKQRTVLHAAARQWVLAHRALPGYPQ